MDKVMGKYEEYRLTHHHLFFPKADYKTPIELAFRSLPENIVMLPAWYHNNLHRWQDPPEKPDEETMILAISKSVEAHKYRHLLKGRR